MKKKTNRIVKVKMFSYISMLLCLFALVFVNIMIASDNGFIIRFIEYQMGLEYRLLAPTFAWLWGTLLTILISCWLVRVRTINWLCKYEIERMDTIVAIKLTTKDNKIKELTQKIQVVEKERESLAKANQAACIMIRQALNIATNPNKKYIYPIKKEISV